MLAGNAIIMIIANKLQNLLTLRVSDEGHSITGWSVTLRDSITGSCVLNYIFTFLLMLNNNLSKTMCHSLIIFFINSLYIHIYIHKCDNKRRYLI